MEDVLKFGKRLGEACLGGSWSEGFLLGLGGGPGGDGEAFKGGLNACRMRESGGIELLHLGPEAFADIARVLLGEAIGLSPLAELGDQGINVREPKNDAVHVDNGQGKATALKQHAHVFDR